MSRIGYSQLPDSPKNTPRRLAPSGTRAKAKADADQRKDVAMTNMASGAKAGGVGAAGASPTPAKRSWIDDQNRSNLISQGGSASVARDASKTPSEAEKKAAEDAAKARGEATMDELFE